MALLKKGDGYRGGDFQIQTGDEAFDKEFEDMLKVSNEELVSAIIGEQVVDKIWARVQRIRSQKHETMLNRLKAEQGE